MVLEESHADVPRVIGPPKPFSDEELMRIEENLVKVAPVILRALIRQSAHQIDSGTQRYVLSPEQTKARMSRARSMLRIALKIWGGKGYETDKRDIEYAYDALSRGDEFEKNPTYHPTLPHPSFEESDLKAVERVITERRSVRRFSDRDVPDELLNRVLEAGRWAPNTCSLQGSRFVIVREAEKKRLIVQPWAAPVIIIAGLDERPYEFIKGGGQLPYNRYLDVGAAIQNMLLMAHALGLGTCVGTFAGEVDSVRHTLKLPDYIKIITYFALGWPEDEPTTVPRMELKEFASRDTWLAP